jgi:hypothetical protein
MFGMLDLCKCVRSHKSIAIGFFLTRASSITKLHSPSVVGSSPMPDPDSHSTDDPQPKSVPTQVVSDDGAMRVERMFAFRIRLCGVLSSFFAALSLSSFVTVLSVNSYLSKIIALFCMIFFLTLFLPFLGHLDRLFRCRVSHERRYEGFKKCIGVFPTVGGLDQLMNKILDLLPGTSKRPEPTNELHD